MRTLTTIVVVAVALCLSQALVLVHAQCSISNMDVVAMDEVVSQTVGSYFQTTDTYLEVQYLKDGSQTCGTLIEDRSQADLLETFYQNNIGNEVKCNTLCDLEIPGNCVIQSFLTIHPEDTMTQNLFYYTCKYLGCPSYTYRLETRYQKIIEDEEATDELETLHCNQVFSTKAEMLQIEDIYLRTDLATGGNEVIECHWLCNHGEVRAACPPTICEPEMFKPLISLNVTNDGENFFAKIVVENGTYPITEITYYFDIRLPDLARTYIENVMVQYDHMRHLCPENGVEPGSKNVEIDMGTECYGKLGIIMLNDEYSIGDLKFIFLVSAAGFLLVIGITIFTCYKVHVKFFTVLVTFIIVAKFTVCLVVMFLYVHDVKGENESMVEYTRCLSQDLGIKTDTNENLFFEYAEFPVYKEFGWAGFRAMLSFVFIFFAFEVTFLITEAYFYWSQSNSRQIGPVNVTMKTVGPGKEASSHSSSSSNFGISNFGSSSKSGQYSA